jgi:hypothetical protein
MSQLQNLDLTKLGFICKFRPKGFHKIDYRGQAKSAAAAGVKLVPAGLAGKKSVRRTLKLSEITKRMSAEERKHQVFMMKDGYDYDERCLW